MNESKEIISIDQQAYIDKQLQEFNATNAAIVDLKLKTNELQIKDFNDRSGYDAVKSTRISIKNLRVSVEKKRKDLNAGALAFQRAINAEANRITELLEPLEEKLLRQQKEFDVHHEQVKAEKLAEAERKRQAILQAERERHEAVLAEERRKQQEEFEIVWKQQREEAARLDAIAKQQIEDEKKLIEAARILQEEKNQLAVVNNIYDSEQKEFKLNQVSFISNPIDPNCRVLEPKEFEVTVEFCGIFFNPVHAANQDLAIKNLEDFVTKHLLSMGCHIDIKVIGKIGNIMGC